MGKLSCAEQDICEAGLARFYSKPFCDVPIFNKDYVTSALPSDQPAICFKNLHDLSTT